MLFLYFDMPIGELLEFTVRLRRAFAATYISAACESSDWLAGREINEVEVA